MALNKTEEYFQNIDKNYVYVLCMYKFKTEFIYELEFKQNQTINASIRHTLHATLCIFTNTKDAS